MVLFHGSVLSLIMAIQYVAETCSRFAHRSSCVWTVSLHLSVSPYSPSCNWNTTVRMSCANNTCHWRTNFLLTAGSTIWRHLPPVQYPVHIIWPGQQVISLTASTDLKVRKLPTNFDQFCVMLFMSECLMGRIVKHNLGLIRHLGSDVDVCTELTKELINFVLYVRLSVHIQNSMALTVTVKFDMWGFTKLLV